MTTAQPDSFIPGITGNDPNLIYIRTLKAGENGQVHILKNRETGELFVRKVMQLLGPTSSNAIENEIRNIDLISKEHHKNLVRVYEHGRLKYYLHGSETIQSLFPVYAIDMELGNGSLAQHIEERFHSSKPPIYFRSVDVWNIMSQIAAGIGFLHRKGIIHRDLKPDNVIQSADNPNVWKLIDFGISVQTSGNPMSTRELKGTAGYVAPEILRGEPYTESVDIYPIGLILFELCTGHRAFSNPPGLYFSPYRVLGPLMVDVASFYATNVITKPFGPINGNVRGLLHLFWDAVRNMSLTDERLFGEAYWRRDSRVEEINRFVMFMSHDNPKCRPSMESVAHHFRANLVRSLLEYDIAYREGVAKAFLILNPSRDLPPRIIRRRLQFLVNVESVCAGENRLEFYNQISLLAKRILVEDVIESSDHEWQELERLLPNRHDLWHDFKQSFVRDQNLTAHEIEFLRREISPPNYDSPSDVQQLDAESPDKGRAQGFYDEASDTSRNQVRVRSGSESQVIQNDQRWHSSANTSLNIGEVASPRGQQQLVSEQPGQQINGNEISVDTPPSLNDQPPNCWQLGKVREELAETERQPLCRYQEWPAQAEAPSGTHESAEASAQPDDPQPTDPASIHCDRVSLFAHESSPDLPQLNLNIPGPSATPDIEGSDWCLLRKSAILSEGGGII